MLRMAARWPATCTGHRTMLQGMTAHLERYLDLLSARQKLVTSNIANGDTPGYKTKDIDFQFEFMSLVDGTKPATIEPKGLVEKPDGNNVSVDRESRLLAENAIRFTLASTLLRGTINMVRSAIQEGRNG
jgi:flagellar basal-body rod protein FlgB